jgi:hypothetical protein
MDSRDFLAQANRLAPSPAPADSRTAISRACYGAFNVAAAHLRDGGFPLGKGAAAHGEIQRCLANAGEPALASAASDLGDLHTRSIRAD